MALTDYSASPNTGDTHSTMAPEAVAQMWDKGCEVFEQTHDFWRQFEGGSPSMPIHSRTDLSKGKGQKITFRIKAGLYGRAHVGDELFTDGTHYEAQRIASDELAVDWFRHASRYTERTEEVMGMRGELFDGLNEDLGEWLGRLKTKHMFMCFLHKGDAGINTRILNGRATINDIESDDTLYYDGLIATGAQLQTSNGKPAYVGKDSGGNPIHKYVIVSTSDALQSLELDPDYKSAKSAAGERGAENLIFKGGYHNLRGHVIKEYTAIDHDGAGPIGSPINPKAELGVAITAGTATFKIKGGGYEAVSDLDRVDYFEDFPNHAFKFMPGDALAAGSTEHFCIIYNRTGADAGKWGMYAFTTNDGQELTVTKRLHSVDGAGGADIRLDQVGSVEWDATKNTNAHPEGSIVILCSKFGASIGYTIMMGSAACRRGYGKYARRRTQQEHEGGHVRDVYITSVFGQAPRRDARGRAPGFVTLAHAIQYPGISIVPTLA